MKTLGLKNKKILITGADGFLGKQITSALIGEGAYVIGTDIKKSMTAEAMDIANLVDVQEYSSKLEKDDVMLDGLVNCSVLSFKGKDISDDQFDDTMSVNIKGAYNCINSFKSLMVSKASVVNISSIFGSKVPDFSNYDGNEDLFNNVSYGCSKSAIEYISKYYAKLYAPIRYNCISPGGIFQKHSRDFVDKYSRMVALKRMGDPDEVINVILFLLSPLSSYITGENIKVDGGFGL